ncbi:MAG TPA: preprotein translocase subunit YajC [Opitutaceae bacterium]|jgi:preprotein translocase subunit YajC
MLKLIAQAAAPQQGGPGMVFIVEMALFCGAFYFFLIAPQRKKQKEHDKMLSKLSTGDEVITTGGIYGVITNVKDDRFVVRVSDNTKIEVGKAFIQGTTKKPQAEEKKSS